MKVKLTLALTLALVMLLALVLALGANAQEPTAEPQEDGSGGEISGQGLTDPAPTGFSVLYMFTGANNDTSTDTVATSVHCTNFDTKAISLTVQFYNNSGGLEDAYTDNLSSNETGTYSTQPTFFSEVPIGAPNFVRGSGRVMATSSKVICTAQLLEPGNTVTPTFVSELEMFKP